MPTKRRATPVPKATRIQLERERLGARLRRFRLAKSLTQAAIGTHLGCGPANVNHIELGRQLPTLAQLRVLAQLYRCSIDDLTDMASPLPASVRTSHKA